MVNQYVLKRIKGIQQQLMATYQATIDLSSASKGNEREFFIDLFLSQVLPSHYRFGTGDATDKQGNRSGQLDVVVEFPFLPSLPLAGGSKYRLYLAESIAAVIEVKSNAANQWDQVVQTAIKLSKISREPLPYTRQMFGGEVTVGGKSTSITGMHTVGDGIKIDGRSVTIAGKDISLDKIPMFVVSYTGWSNIESIKEKIEQNYVDGILIIDNGFYLSNRRFGNFKVEGSSALWALICNLHEAISMLSRVSLNPWEYLSDS